jgi:polyribonucleotide nucleotidyltransferase
MDFKVAGTTKGITALQMDIKIKGITAEIMRQALQQANVARLSILDQMLDVIPVPRPELRSFVPRISIMKVPVDKIGAIIGPGGKMIRALQEETNTKIDIDDDGTVYIAATDSKNEAAARERIAALTESAQIGRIYTGKVVRVADFGAFVQILPGIDGMVHISQLDTERVEKVEDVVHMGDELTVMVTAVDENGKIRLSRQAVLEGWTPEEALEHDKGGRSGGSRPRPGGGDRRGGSGQGRPFGGNRNSGGDRNSGSRR